MLYCSRQGITLRGDAKSVEASSLCEYFQKNDAIRILDHIFIMSMKEVNLEAALNANSTDLPSPELFQIYVQYTSVSADLRPVSLTEAIKDCDPAVFPTSVSCYIFTVQSSHILQMWKKSYTCAVSIITCEHQWEKSLVLLCSLIRTHEHMTHQFTSTGWWIVTLAFIPVGMHWILCSLNLQLNS